ncbi:phage tail tape measure protein [Aeromonas veronii]|uniref:Phage tail tape measure protein n=1 Tax=Aeromonas veronii TaxID=654 RepID=A0A3A9J5Q6_AERVE|nr:phage tail tape measure protein [Aeromonas veronii]RKJ92186.1 phage tail tape measure protein [Aeromonas veronii]
MASATEQLMMRIGLIDAATRPLQGIKRELAQVKQVAGAGFAQLAGGGAAIAAGAMAIQAALGPAIEMDRALGEVASLDVSQTGLQLLGEEALRFSVEYGKSATEFVRASYDIQSAIGGLSEQELPAFTRASAVLAAATKADTGTITSYMGTMYGIFKQQAAVMGKAEWVEAVAGKTATAVQMFKTTGQGMADAFQGVQSTATSLGISMDEQFAVLGTLQASMGGAVAGTAYKSFLSSIPKAGKELGLSFYDATGQMLPMVNILELIQGKFGELDGAEIGALQKAFGETATPVILGLISDTDALKGSIDALGQARGMDKATLMAAAMTDQYERVEAAWFAIRAALFSAVLPSINKVVGVFADGAGVVLRWTKIFPNLSKLVAYTVLAIAGLGIVTGTWLVLAAVAKLATLAWTLSLGKLLKVKTYVWMYTKLHNGAMRVWAVTVFFAKVAAFAFSAALWVLKAALWAVKIAMGIGAFVAWLAIMLVTKVAVFAFNAALLVIKGTLAAFRAIMLAVNSVMLANPAVLIVLAIIALVAAIALGIVYWDEIKAALADTGVFTALGIIFDTLTEGWRKFTGFLADLSPFKLLGAAAKWLIDLVNKFSSITGITIGTEGMGDLPSAPNVAAPEQAVNSPLASYRQQGARAPAVGGLGQQLIQKNASVTAMRQPPAKTLTTGDINMYVQNPMTPEELSRNTWLEQRG